MKNVPWDFYVFWNVCEIWGGILANQNFGHFKIFLSYIKVKNSKAGGNFPKFH